MVKHDPALDVEVPIVNNAWVRVLDDRLQHLLTLLDRFSAKVMTRDRNEVEGAQRCRVIATITSNQVENGKAVLIANDRLAIDQAGTHGQFCDRDYYARKAMIRLTRDPSRRARMRKPSCLIS